MVKLTKKQTEQLSGMSHEALLAVIHDLIQDNKQAKDALISEYLSSAPDRLKAIEKEYARRAKSKRFYDYYDADALFDELTRAIARPLEKLADTQPEHVEGLTVKIMLEFEKFTGNVDTSSGSWMDYYQVLFDAWMKSLAAQKNSEPVFIAKKIFTIIEHNFYFSFEILQHYRALLGADILRAVRGMYYQNKRIPEALGISVIIKDIEFITASHQKGEFSHPEHYFDYARLLLDDVRANEAVDLLLGMDKEYIKNHTNNSQWNELLVIALIEDGRKEEAKEQAIKAFSLFCTASLYQLYKKASGQGDDNIQTFLDIAKSKGLIVYIRFAVEVERFDLIDDCVTSTPKEKLATTLESLSGSSVRTLSSELYKYGYALSATLLRRFLVEASILQAKSKYYSYAASDMKKAIDYSEGLEESLLLPGTQRYLSALYNAHKRKVSLWPLMTARITGLSIRNDEIYYNGSQS
jgi:hypothetical protein